MFCVLKLVWWERKFHLFEQNFFFDSFSKNKLPKTYRRWTIAIASLFLSNIDLSVRRGNLLDITWPHLSSSCSIHLKFLLLQWTVFIEHNNNDGNEKEKYEKADKMNLYFGCCCSQENSKVKNTKTRITFQIWWIVFFLSSLIRQRIHWISPRKKNEEKKNFNKLDEKIFTYLSIQFFFLRWFLLLWFLW